jgi:hypothetical protein
MGLLLGLPFGSSSADSLPAERVVAELEMHPSKDGIFAPIRIDGQDYLFLLDTGANLTVLDARFRPLLGAPIGRRRIATPEGGQPIAGYAPIDLRLGGLDVNDGSPYLIGDFEPARQVTGIPFYGIVGIGFMRRFAWDLDFDAGKVRILSGLRAPPLGFSAVVPIAWRRGLPEIPASAGGLTAPYVLDTGQSGAGTLLPPVYARLKALGAFATELTDFSLSLGGVGAVRFGCLHALGIGGLNFEGYCLRQAAANSLGMKLLKRTRALIDFPGKRLYLKKRERIDRPLARDKSGLRLAQRDGRVRVLAVFARSPAARAGIEVGDELVSVNDRPVKSMQLWALKDLLRGETGSLVRICARREGRVDCAGIRLQEGFTFASPKRP